MNAIATMGDLAQITTFVTDTEAGELNGWIAADWGVTLRSFRVFYGTLTALGKPASDAGLAAERD